MENGYNKMSDNATYCLRYNGSGTYPDVWITHNAFPYFLNTYGLTLNWTGKPYRDNIDDDEYEVLSPYCGDIYDIQIIDNPEDPNNNHSSIEVIKDGIANQDIKAIFQSFYSFNPGIDTKKSFEIINNELNENQTGNSDEFRNEMNILKADIALKLGDKEKASEILSGIDESMGGILRLKAGDKVQGTTGSGLLKIVSNCLDIKCDEAQTETKEALPGLDFALEQNKPNPFSNSTDIEFTLPVPTSVSLVITDMYGNKISTLINNSVQSPGRHKVTFDTEGIASGVYVYSLFANGTVLSKLMHVVK